MSSLSQADLAVVSTLVDFLRGPGYVLDFSDRTFSQFFGSEFNVDIDDPKYADAGTSKGKRLRRFLQLTDDGTAAQVLSSLWRYREALVEGSKDPVANAEGRFRAVLAKVSSASGPKTRRAIAQPDADAYRRLKEQVTGLASMQPHPRGYAFQDFLYELFSLHGCDPKKSFRNRGEEIDGSFEMDGSFYLLEAKWQAKPVGVQQLHGFEGKLSEKAPWGRGLFISYVGFSPDGLDAFGRGKRTICMDGFDLFEMLDRDLPLHQVLNAKARKAAETGLPYVRVRDLF